MNNIKNGLLIFVVLFVFISSSAQYATEITVAKDGSGDYTSIQDAIDASKAFPDKRVRVYIKNGIYHEKIKIPACNTRLSLIGENVENTIITYDDYFDKIDRGRNSTFYTFTLKVEANDFYAENLTIRNTAGPIGQAVALHVVGDRCSFKNCKILGHQDTVYAAGESSRQYFSNCYIEGTTDFIFGAATALFDDCILHSLRNSYITAASTTKGKAFGYVFRNCKLTAAEDVNEVYLGRPWRPYAKTVFMNCEMGDHIIPDGWDNWGDPSREETTFYAEYNNTGECARTANRVNWSHQLSDDEAALYSTENILARPVPEEPMVIEWISPL